MLKKFIYNCLPFMNRKSNKGLTLVVLSLVLFGFVMVMSTLGGKDPEKESLLFEAIKGAGFIVIAYWGMCVMSKMFSLKWWYQKHWMIGIPLIGAMIATLFFPETYGARAWIYIGPVSIQPVEFVKVFMIIILALYIELGKASKVGILHTIKVPLFYLFVFAAIIVVQKDFGALIILLVIISCLVLFTTNRKFKPLKKFILFCMLAGAIFCAFGFTQQGVDFLSSIPFISYFAIRFQNTLNPFVDTANAGYQMVHGLYGFAHGGIGGVGLGNSIQKYGYLTQSESDYILSIIVEEIGLLGLFIVVGCYFLIIAILLNYAKRAKSEGYRFILVGTSIYIFTHFVLNVGGVSGLIPLTGVPLLFVSSGGSSLVSIMGCIGVCQAVIAYLRRNGSVMKKKKRA